MRVHVPLESVGVVRGVGQPLIPETCEFELRDFLHREHPRREREIRDRVERLPQRQRLLGELLERRSRARAGRARDRRELGEDAARVCEQLVAVVADEHLVEGLDLDALRHGAEHDRGVGLDDSDRLPRALLRREGVDQEFADGLQGHPQRLDLLADLLEKLFSPREGLRRIPTETHARRRRRRRILQPFDFQRRRVDAGRRRRQRLFERRVSLLVGAAGADEGLHAALAPPFSLPRQPVLVLHPLHQNDIASSAAPVLARDRQRDNAARVDFAIAVVDAGHRVRPII
ncbi:hypothetical protein M885DRAFT_551447 [Pelagophyceae sp. CCMP2097]|nr:hypothetical protein M885DRAFT_551447 [Pelagophyceae sp. CCMP2097]